MGGNIKANLVEANKSLKLAGHILHVTFPLIKDYKLFTGVIDSIDKSLKLALDSLLYYERMYKRISPYPDNFTIKLDILRRLVSKRYNINNEIPNFILDINQIVKNRREAKIEFPRKEGFVICDSSYKIRILKLEELKDYYLKAKFFILTVGNIINEDK